MKEAKSSISIPKNKKHRRELFARIQANLLGERIEGDDKPIGYPSEREVFLSRILKYFFEIDESLKRIEMCENYLSGRIPKKFNKIEFLRYHYEYFLHEFYVYEQRLEGLLNHLSKIAKRKELKDEKVKIDVFKEVIIQALEKLLIRRGRHVHERRFKSDKFDQLTGLDLYSSFDDIGAYFTIYRDEEFAKEKIRIIKEISSIRTTLTDIVEIHLYKELGKTIFDKILKSHKGKK